MPMDVALKGLLGAAVAILLHFAINSRHHYLAGLIPLFPTFALLAHMMFASSGRTADMQVSAQFGLLSLLPYAVYLLLVWLLADRLNTWLALILSTAGWTAVAAVLFVAWNSAGTSRETAVQAVHTPGTHRAHRPERPRFSGNQDANLMFLRSQPPRRFSSGDLREEIALLEQAVRLDPDFARAWAALATSQGLLAIHDAGFRTVACRKALAADRRARGLDPVLGMPPAVTNWLRLASHTQVDETLAIR